MTSSGEPKETASLPPYLSDMLMVTLDKCVTKVM